MRLSVTKVYFYTSADASIFAIVWPSLSPTHPLFAIPSLSVTDFYINEHVFIYKCSFLLLTAFLAILCSSLCSPTSFVVTPCMVRHKLPFVKTPRKTPSKFSTRCPLVWHFYWIFIFFRALGQRSISFDVPTGASIWSESFSWLVRAMIRNRGDHKRKGDAANIYPKILSNSIWQAYIHKRMHFYMKSCCDRMEQGFSRIIFFSLTFEDLAEIFISHISKEIQQLQRHSISQHANRPPWRPSNFDLNSGGPVQCCCLPIAPIKEPVLDTVITGGGGEGVGKSPEGVLTLLFENFGIFLRLFLRHIHMLSRPF